MKKLRDKNSRFAAHSVSKPGTSYTKTRFHKDKTTNKDKRPGPLTAEQAVAPLVAAVQKS